MIKEKEGLTVIKEEDDESDLNALSLAGGIDLSWGNRRLVLRCARRRVIGCNCGGSLRRSPGGRRRSRRLDLKQNAAASKMVMKGVDSESLW